jgi:hypothetical protein
VILLLQEHTPDTRSPANWHHCARGARLCTGGARSAAVVEVSEAGSQTEPGTGTQTEHTSSAGHRGRVLYTFTCSYSAFYAMRVQCIQCVLQRVYRVVQQCRQSMCKSYRVQRLIHRAMMDDVTHRAVHCHVIVLVLSHKGWHSLQVCNDNSCIHVITLRRCKAQCHVWSLYIDQM